MSNIAFPPEFLAQIAEDSLTPGQVFRTVVQHPDGESSPKRVVVLTSNNSETVLGVVSTTKVERRQYYGDWGVLIPAGSDPVFEEESFIELFRVYMFPTEKIQQLYINKKLHFLGTMSENYLLQIYDGVKTSATIPEVDKNRIESERGVGV